MILYTLTAAAWMAGPAVEVDPRLLRKRNEPAPVLVVLRDQPDVRGIRAVAHGDARLTAVVGTLRDHAEQAQASLVTELDNRGIAYKRFWAINAIALRADGATIDWLRQRPEIAELAWDGPSKRVADAADELGDTRPKAVEQGLTLIGAPTVWAQGFRGQGVLVAGQDTGYLWTHPALQGKYAGWDGTTADHNYHWHDAITNADPGNPCGSSTSSPCDDDALGQGHGTHTMGTMIGDDGGSNQIGVAPDARWIGCRNMDEGNGTPSTYADCFQFFLAPTDLAGNNPDPLRAPHVINNSWGCPTSEGCIDPAVLQTLVENVKAAGILVVVSAGNSGTSGCGTVNTPAAIYEASFSVGNTNSSDNMVASSSRGPVTVDGSNRIKPNVTAPGQSIRSSLRTGGYGFKTGTSMSGPHVAGAAALLMSADPSLKRDPERIEDLLEQTAAPVNSTQTCGGIPTTTIPNPVFGHGRIDVAAALTLLRQSIFGNGFE
ncbi:MAG: S8 family serine peptidase [Xanthomonadales bacterium]|nr:S8 family serine peptidase [Xanthomonadales bacterium]